MLNQDADLAEFLAALSKRELKLYPRSPAIVSPYVAKAIDMSGIMKMSPEQIDEALRQMEAA